jgi:hypothetical protein
MSLFFSHGHDNLRSRNRLTQMPLRVIGKVH